MINKEWKVLFSKVLKDIFNCYSLDYKLFSDKYKISASAIGYWLSGRNLPQQILFNDLKLYLNENIKDHTLDAKIREIIYGEFEKHNLLAYYNQIMQEEEAESIFCIKTLGFCYDMAKNNINLCCKEVATEGIIKAVVFDFDGTLTETKTNKTTWESIWTSLGYDVRLCQELHEKFNNNDISHEEWCELTAQKFRERSLNQDIVEQIAKKIKLIKGVKETFEELRNKDIKIYIVSGSILLIIQKVLGNLFQYVDAAKANVFCFDKNKILSKIIGTKYDFEGKAKFISEIAFDLNIAPKDILFVGNSINDQFAYLSGAKTLCINPKITDVTNKAVWNYCIQTCRNLNEILKYINN